MNKLLNLFRLTTLDRYLVRKFLGTWAFALLICTLIAVAIDFSEKVQSFIEKPCTWKEILTYELGFMVHMASLLMPMYTLIAVVFFTSRLAFNSEILSILNAGVSFGRLMRPYLVASGVVFLSHFLINHLIAPLMNKERLRFEHTYVWTDQEKGRTANVHLLLSPTVKAHIRGYNKSSKVVNGLRLEEFSGNRVSKIIEAENARWKAEPNIWELTSHTVRTFDGLKESYKRINQPIDTAINLTPQDFIFYQNQNQEMTTPELQSVIDRDKQRGLSNTRMSESEKYRRTADALTNIILAIIGLAVAGRKVRGGMGLHLALGIGIGAIFILLSKFAVSFASSGSLPVWLAMWIPNIVFGAIAIWLVAKAQK
ncbi:MAG: LptF/LptG family permease [Saprospiraceae bacterium]|nr:LptF/LptG family permease [Saprospiraceae bacterium]